MRRMRKCNRCSVFPRRPTFHNQRLARVQPQRNGSHGFRTALPVPCTTWKTCSDGGCYGGVTGNTLFRLEGESLLLSICLGTDLAQAVRECPPHPVAALKTPR